MTSGPWLIIQAVDCCSSELQLTACLVMDEKLLSLRPYPNYFLARIV